MRLSTALADFLFPRRCPFCGALVREDLPCETCQTTLPWLTGDSAEGSAEFVSRFASALRYEGEVRSCIRRVKFSRKPAGIRTLGLLTGQCAAGHFSGDADLVTWVPLSPRGLRDRGFDQARLLAKEVAPALSLPLVSLFAKENGRAAQSTLADPAARRANVLGAFRLKSPEKVLGKRVLIVDDVITTGATLSECARLLRAAGAADVLGVSLARALRGKVEQK